MKSSSVTIQMKATEQYFPVVLFIMLYKVVLTFESVDEILLCDHSNGTSLPVFSRGIFFSHHKDFVTLFTSGSKRGNGNNRELVSTILLREVST